MIWVSCVRPAFRANGKNAHWRGSLSVSRAEFRPGDLAVVPPPGTRNTIRIEPRTTLKSTEKEMKTDGKLPVSKGHKRVSPLRVGPAPVLSSLATGNSILFP